MASHSANMQLVNMLPLIMVLGMCVGAQGRELLQGMTAAAPAGAMMDGGAMAANGGPMGTGGAMGAMEDGGPGRQKCISECSTFVNIDTSVQTYGEAKLYYDEMGTLGSMGVILAGYTGNSVAHVHNTTCDVEDGGPHWQQIVGGPEDTTNEFWYEFGAPLLEARPYYFAAEFNTAVEVPPPGPGGGNAIVVHDADGARLACCDLTPCESADDE